MILAEVGLQDGIGLEDVIAFSAGATTVLVFLGLLHRLFLKKVVDEAKDFFSWWKKFQRDWDGEPEEPGRSKVPGVMERLNRIDGELKRNGGSSLKDEVCKTAAAVKEVDHKIKAMQEQVDTLEARQQEIRLHVLGAESA